MMTDPQATIFIETAKVIDAYDREVEDVNDKKKAYYAGVKNILSQDDFTALKDAIKERRKARKKGEPPAEHYEARTDRVWQIISILERQSPQDDDETSVDPVSAPAIGHSRETAPTRDAREAEVDLHPWTPPDTPPHDQETGEIIEPQAAPSPAAVITTRHEFPPYGDDPADNPNAPADALSHQPLSQGGEVRATVDASPPVSDELPDLPPFLDRKRQHAEAVP